MMQLKIYLYIILFILTSVKTENQNITIIGKAMNAKAGAIVISDKKGMFYLEGLSSWDKKHYGKKVKVIGTLLIEQNEKSGKDKVEVQETLGTKKIIKKPKWILLE